MFLNLPMEGTFLQGDLRDLELPASLQPAAAALDAWLLEGGGAAVGHDPVAALQGLQVVITNALEQGLATGCDDGNPTTTVGTTSNGRAKYLHCQQCDLLLLVQATDDWRARVRHLSAIHPRGHTLVSASRVLFSVWCCNRGLLFSVALVLGEVNVLALAGLRTHLLRHCTAVGHLCVVRDRNPFVTDHVCSVLVAEERWVLDPSTCVTRALCVAAAIYVTSGN
mmetsp:Transcript_86462/g.253022  ORF Transcript_86462/g.253022 Transcript_86462/m.253022 type:complete len:224 (-) Transcript_86462:658-1329(-)